MPMQPNITQTKQWRDMYNAHRHRVHTAKAETDSSSPQLNVHNFFKASELRADTENYKRINKMNFDLLVSMNGYMRTEGVVRPWMSRSKTRLQFSRVYENTKWLEQVEESNRELGERLKAARPSLTTRRSEDELRERKKCFAINLEAVERTLKKYERCKLTLPKEPNQLRRLLRPLVFMDIGMPGVCGTDRVVIKLYTEACPEAVLEFMRIFRHERADSIKFMRLFPNLFLEGEIKLSKEALRVGKTEYDKRCINHGSSGGILSIPKFLEKGCHNRTLLFSISFRPLRILNGERIGFGRVCRGFRFLKHLRNNGMKNGSLFKPIVISKLGIVDQ